ncbi:DNase I-like protein [Heliocybe sulcata]|uniref:DNase I-like protein n=1 Tax=Heliocybe sulcata TaxID=5364 RepID=A0A5C3N3I5_9AGAM|nr:DNase I-like protein [Heliocybe sulcata]
MRRRLFTTQGQAASSKWTNIHALVRDQRLGILTLQETHLTPTLVDDIHNLFGHCLLIFNSSDPNNPTSSAGVAFILNREVMSTSHSKVHEIIPSQALLLTTTWHNSASLSVLNVYAPNDYHQQTSFWETLEEYWSDHALPKPDFMLGDFNLVEDPIDRSPPRLDLSAPSVALQDLQLSLNLVDAWRTDRPSERNYTFRTSSNSFSRID